MSDWDVPGRSNMIFRGRPGNVGVGRPRVVLGTSICRLGWQQLRMLFTDTNSLLYENETENVYDDFSRNN